MASERKGKLYIKTGAGSIGEYGYAHYAHQPPQPGTHELLTVPNTITDSWLGFCSCGEWAASASLYDFSGDGQAALAELRHGHEEHAHLPLPEPPEEA